MSGATAIVLRRACSAVRVPSGDDLVLEAGEEVWLVQQLGASCTVQHPRIGLVRIALVDADALGLDVEATPDRSDGAAADDGAGVGVEQILDDLRQVYDPEIPINIVDLGLIYSCDTEPTADGRQLVRITMGVTAPGCGMGDVLGREVKGRVETLPGVADVEVVVTFDPPWDLSRMSDAARLQLGL